MLDQKNVAHILTVDLGYPAALPVGIEVGDKSIHDACNEGFEGVVPSVLLRIANALPIDNPSHIADTVRPQDERRPVAIDFHENALDALHAMNKFRSSRRGQVLENRVSLILGKSIELL